ncbi:MAG: nucleotidyltransferase domain-containing protein [Candidatus Hydrogenedentes bacterium]|nr:nucleotidyltransferase domain-containing protein [Candidatus Hydrogenedentota bacterium]
MIPIAEADVISAADKALLADVKAAIQSVLPDAEVYLFGSTATGKRGPESDYDLLVLTDETVSKDARRRAEKAQMAVELSRDVILSTLYLSKSEWQWRMALPFHDEVERDGVLL